jgi:L-2,4-diaminobutyric acid acetyltransferase
MSDVTSRVGNGTGDIAIEEISDGRRHPSLSPPAAADGAAIWRLVCDDGTLERNSAYAYMLLGAHFRGTSVVARRNGAIEGFVWAYIVPHRPDTVFVWQIGVTAASRGLGLGSAMLREIVSRPECGKVAFVEATVTPSNKASMALFLSFARHARAPLDMSVGFDRRAFPDPGHETEMLIRIGPLGRATHAERNSKE